MLAMQFLEKHAQPNAQAFHPKKKSEPSTETAAMIAIRGSKIVYAPMDEVLKHTDLQKRRGDNTWWSGVKELVEVLGGRAGVMVHLEKEWTKDIAARVQARKDAKDAKANDEGKSS